MLSSTKSRLAGKTFLQIFLFFLTLYDIRAQNIPNGDFEEWFTCLCDPPYWVTNNLYPPPLECLQVFPSGSPYSGDFCVEGIVDTCPELSVLRPPLIQSFEIPLSSKPEALHGFYKYIPIGEDLFVASIQTYLNSDLIGEGVLKSQQLVSDYTEFILNIEYTTNDIPDVAVIKFTIDSSLSSNKIHQGSKWYIDYLFFGPISDVDDEDTNIPNSYSLSQNYPNPFNPVTNIKYSVPEISFVTIKLYAVLGNEVTTLVNEEKEVGNYKIDFDGSRLSSGIYFYKIQTEKFVEIKKMVLLK